MVFYNNSQNKLKEVSLGYNHSGVITEDGSLYMWGNNSNGQVSNVISEDLQSTPVKLMNNVKSISLGGYHSGAITNDGSLWMWGKDNLLGNGEEKIENSKKPIKIIDDAQCVELGKLNSAAITSDGVLWMWGDNSYDQTAGSVHYTMTFMLYSPVRIKDYLRFEPYIVKNVSLGYKHSGFVENNGNLRLFGERSYGKLGTGDNYDYSDPKLIMKNVNNVSLGDCHSAAIAEDGSLYMWGGNQYGQLGTGSHTNHSNPYKLADNVKMVSLGSYHSGMIKEDGTLYMWGRNDYGQIGNGTTDECTTPVKIMENVKYLSLGEYHSAAIKEDGSLWMWGRNDSGQIGDGTTENRLKPVEITNFISTEKTEYIVNFDSNGGTPVASQQIASGKPVKKPSNPKKEGYTFTGWYKEEACINAWNFSKDKVTGDITLFAGWKSKNGSRGDGVKKLRYWDDDMGREKEASINWSGKLFAKNPSDGNKNLDLTLLSAIISANVNTSKVATHAEMERIRDNLGAIGINENDIAIGNYYHENIDDLGFDDFGEASKYAYLIAGREIQINGEATNLIMVAARGTTTGDEISGDGTSYSGPFTEFAGHDLYNIVFSFEEELFKGLDKYLDSHELVTTNGEKMSVDDYLDNGRPANVKLKFLVTGHSLGGAAANLLGERLTRHSRQSSSAWWSEMSDPSDIFVYTFGALNSIAENSVSDGNTVLEGYENIHNIFNFYDSFGPKGGITSVGTNWLGIYHIGSATGKFGRIDMFEKDYGELLSNHQIWNYIDAVRSCIIDYNFQYNSSVWKQAHMYACPVNIEVYKGKSLVARIVDDKVDLKSTKIPASVNDGIKFFILKGSGDYKVRVTGTATGTMDAFIEDYNIDKSSKLLTDIAIYNDKEFEVPVSGAVDATDINMYVLDQNENISKTVQTNGTEEEIKNVYIVNQKVKLDSLFWNEYDTFKVSSKSFASINKNMLTPKKAGTVTVYAMRKKDKTLYAKEKVNLIFEKPSFKEKTITFTRYGESAYLADNLTNTHKLPNQWISSNEKIASIKDGVLTVNGKGSAKITAVYGESKNAAKYSFNVKCNIPVISKKSAQMLTGATLKLKLNNTKKTPSWISSNSEVATVSEGMVTALTPGNVKISAVLDGISYSCEIVVKAPAMKKAEMKVKAGKTVTVGLKDTKLKNLKWWSDNESIATVDEKGKVTGISSGITYVYTSVGYDSYACKIIVE